LLSLILTSFTSTGIPSNEAWNGTSTPSVKAVSRRHLLVFSVGIHQDFINPIPQLDGGIANWPYPVSVDAGVFRRSRCERIAATSQVRERCIEGRQHCRNGGAFGRDAAKVVTYQTEEALLLATLEPDDRCEVLQLFGREVVQARARPGSR
jgi:hypothetical protein